jgi:DNA polymerase elongation subunit (family B)
MGLVPKLVHELLSLRIQIKDTQKKCGNSFDHLKSVSLSFVDSAFC